MEVILATSRLTFWTSSSESCCSSSALACSPNTTSSIAAFLRPAADSSLAGPTAMACVPGRSLLFLADPGAQDLGRNVRFLGDPLAQMFGQHFGVLSDHRGQFETAQHLCVALLLQGVALREL